MVSTLRISRQQLAAFLKNDHDAIRQFETLFSSVANQDTDADVVEPEIQIEVAGNLALARIERLERAFQMLELAPAPVPASTESAAAPTAGGLTPIEEIALTADQSSITFSDIPQGYRNLIIKMTARGTHSVEAIDVYMRANGDTNTANYARTFIFEYDNSGSGTIGSGGNKAIQAGQTITFLASASAPSNRATSATITIFDYARTYWYKNAIDQHTFSGSTTKQWITSSGWEWRSTAAITSLTLAPANGNFATGSVFSLYGEL